MRYFFKIFEPLFLISISFIYNTNFEIFPKEGTSNVSFMFIVDYFFLKKSSFDIF